MMRTVRRTTTTVRTQAITLLYILSTTFLLVVPLPLGAHAFVTIWTTRIPKTSAVVVSTPKYNNHQPHRQNINGQRQSDLATTATTTTTCLPARWGNTDDIEGLDRYKSCIPYLLPLLDGEIFGRYIYERVPPLGFLDALFIGPLYETYRSIPFLGLILFVTLTLGTRLNLDMNRNLRFNAQQAALIDVALVFPELIGAAFEGEDIPRYLAEPCSNFVWYCYMSMVLYCMYSNVVLKTKPNQIPWISGYAETMTGPI
jgi:hypothetical protein